MSENHFEPASWAGYEKAMGAPPPTLLENKKFKPSLLSAFREQQGGKGKYVVAARPHAPSWGRKAPDPISWHIRRPDAIQPGQLPEFTQIKGLIEAPHL